MQKQILILAIVLSLIALMTSSAVAQQWAVKADAADGCSCQGPCPCTFGNPPTLGYCQGNMLWEIKEGNHGDVRVDGLSVVITYDFGKWTKLYISDKATDDQVDAIKQIIQKQQTLPFGEILSVEKIPLSVERSASKVAFSAPASTVEMEVVKGSNGKPTKILNSFLISEYTLYKTIKTTHQTEDTKFSYSGTFVSISKVLAFSPAPNSPQRKSACTSRSRLTVSLTSFVAFVLSKIRPIVVFSRINASCQSCFRPRVSPFLTPCMTTSSICSMD